MDAKSKKRARGRRLLDQQLRLLEIKRGEVEALCSRGGGPDDGLANDLAGIRLVLTSALLAGGLGEAERKELERREREARELFAVSTRPVAAPRATVRRF